MDNERAKELAEAHWEYVEGLLTAIGYSGNGILVAEYMYKTAFEHGWKHSLEGKEAALNNVPENTIKNAETPIQGVFDFS